MPIFLCSDLWKGCMVQFAFVKMAAKRWAISCLNSVTCQQNTEHVTRQYEVVHLNVLFIAPCYFYKEVLSLHSCSSLWISQPFVLFIAPLDVCHKIISFLKRMCVCLGMCAVTHVRSHTHMIKCLQRQKQGIGFFGTGVTCIFESPDMSAGIRTAVFVVEQ